MRRLVTVLVFFGVISFSYAQFRVVKVPAHLIKKAEKVPDKTPLQSGIISKPDIIGQKYDEAIVGETIYDLQTYNSLQQRIYAYPDGTIGLTWMMGFETGAWGDRGTGYNYFNGQEWDTYPTIKLESVSTGWPCYAPYGENGEIVAAFYLEDPQWGIIFNKREQKGEGNWEEFYLSGPDDIGIAFPAMITSGPDNSYIHLIVVTIGEEYMGQPGALLYYRSLNGGETWDIEHEFFEELGPDFLTRVPGDGYSWADPRGDTLAFSAGFRSENGYIMKSFDNGDNWQKIAVYENPYSPYQGGATPVFGAGDFTSSVALDIGGKAHLTFGRMKYYYNNAGQAYYYPGTEGVIYWNEDMNPLDTTAVSSYTLDHLINKGNLVGWVTPYNGDSTLIDWGDYYVSLTSYPQINIDEQNRIFILYSGVAAGYHNGSKNFRHIFGNSSNDGGISWNGIKDFNTDINYTFTECMYSPMSPTFTDNKIHFFFQNDDFAGLHVWTNEHGATTNNMVYMPIEISFLTATEKYETTEDNFFEVSQNYPNPFSDKSNIIVNLKTKSYLHFSILNFLGQVVHEINLGLKDKGKHRIEIDRKNLKPGIYFYVVSTEMDEVTGKMIIR